jgi:hypothetical protein
MARACSSAFDRTYGPGWVSEEGHWQRSDNACQSSQFIQRFRDTPSSKYVDEFPTLVNKTMFILGDSVGRQLWDQLCFEIGAPKNVRYPPGVEPAVHYSEASVCTQPELNFTIVGFHQYGESPDRVLDLFALLQTIADILSDLSLGFANATDPTTLSYLEKCFPGGPYDYETRVPNLWNTLLTDIPEPDYISISGGAWDYLYMFNRDIIEKRFHNSIPEEDLKTFSGRLKGLIGMMGEMFPRSKVVWINMHPLNNVDLGAKHNWGGGYFQPPLDRSVDSVLFPPLFSQRRLAQHAQALRLAAEEEGVDSLDVSLDWQP